MVYFSMKHPPFLSQFSANQFLSLILFVFGFEMVVPFVLT